jgi:hypothetical protein
VEVGVSELVNTFLAAHSFSTESFKMKKGIAEMEKVNQAIVQDEDTPQNRHMKKLIEEQSKQKAENKVVSEWYEIMPDLKHKRGGKVKICKKMTNGNVHKLYIGRITDCSDVLANAKKSGKKVIGG